MPQILLTNKAELAIRYAVLHDKNLEVGGFGHTIVDAEGNILVTDIIIPAQEVSGGETDIATTGLDSMLRTLAAREESFDEWRFWWHSHGNNGTFYSGTDHSTLTMLARNVGGWFSGMVITNKLERKGFLDVREPFPIHTEIPVLTLPVEDEDLRRLVEEQMANVKRKTYTPPSRPWQQGGGANQGNANSRSNGTATNGATSTDGRQATASRAVNGRKAVVSRHVGVLTAPKPIQDMSDEELTRYIDTIELDPFTGNTKIRGPYESKRLDSGETVWVPRDMAPSADPITTGVADAANAHGPNAVLVAGRTPALPLPAPSLIVPPAEPNSLEELRAAYHAGYDGE